MRLIVYPRSKVDTAFTHLQRQQPSWRPAPRRVWPQLHVPDERYYQFPAVVHTCPHVKMIHVPSAAAAFLASSSSAFLTAPTNNIIWLGLRYYIQILCLSNILPSTSAFFLASISAARLAAAILCQEIST